jgi:hypothetical protein
LIHEIGVVATIWIGTLLSTAVVTISTASLLAIKNAVPPQVTNPKTKPVASLRHLPRIYWYLSLVSILGYGGINSFNNSAQRFLASRFYNGDERPAGLAARYATTSKLECTNADSDLAV